LEPLSRAYKLKNAGYAPGDSKITLRRVLAVIANNPAVKVQV
jgi:hypothetical protein